MTLNSFQTCHQVCSILLSRICEGDSWLSNKPSLLGENKYQEEAEEVLINIVRSILGERARRKTLI